MLLSLLTLLAASLWSITTIAQAYFPSEVVELGIDSNGPLGLTQSPNIQNINNGLNAIEMNFDITPSLPNGTICSLDLNLYGTYNNNNSTWVAWLGNSGHVCLNVFVLDTCADPNKDTFAKPALSAYYGTMDIRMAAIGLNVTFDPPTVPCGKNFMIQPQNGSGEFELSWDQDPNVGRGLELLAKRPYPPSYPSGR